MKKEAKLPCDLGIDTLDDLHFGSARIESLQPAIRALFESCDLFLACSLWTAWSGLLKDGFRATILGLLARAEDRLGLDTPSLAITCRQADESLRHDHLIMP